VEDLKLSPSKRKVSTPPTPNVRASGISKVFSEVQSDSELLMTSKIDPRRQRAANDG
jgi:hypothetical protein